MRWEPLLYYEDQSMDKAVGNLRKRYLKARIELVPVIKEPLLQVPESRRGRYYAFGEYLHKTFMLNLGNGWGTKSRFARRIGVHPAVLSQYFPGKMLPGQDVLKKMVPVLKEPYESLMQKTEEAKSRAYS